MELSEISWDEAVALFKERGVPESTWENLYEGEYVLCAGDAVVEGNFPLNGGDEHPWGDYDIGYIVDGDLTVAGCVYDEDDGAAALVVLGDLRAKGISIASDPKIVVKGNTEVDVLFAQYTDKYLDFGGDLRGAVQVWLDECAPDRVGGTLAGALELPSYLGVGDLGATSVARADVPVGELVVADALDDEGKVDGEALHNLLIGGEPVLRG
ncbi:hypothetical protein [Actinokineospora inagensis]|uniref:hypothetical protein n=1 Tax=Actinokineospora inagensis TaxID=103730 RepID=UPI000425E3C7|nr:hypothetical protein [Actinokineospora inagensis]